MRIEARDRGGWERGNTVTKIPKLRHFLTMPTKIITSLPLIPYPPYITNAHENMQSSQFLQSTLVIGAMFAPSPLLWSALLTYINYVCNQSFFNQSQSTPVCDAFT